jgi:hypothetical protein
MGERYYIGVPAAPALQDMATQMRSARGSTNTIRIGPDIAFNRAEGTKAETDWNRLGTLREERRSN